MAKASGSGSLGFGRAVSASRDNSLLVESAVKNGVSRRRIAEYYGRLTGAARTGNTTVDLVSAIHFASDPYGAALAMERGILR